MFLRLGILLILCSVQAGAQTVPDWNKGNVVHYQANIDNVKYVYGVAPPVARIQPGNVLEPNSLDCFGNALQKPGDSFSLVKGDNPLTGPFIFLWARPRAHALC